MLWIDAKLVYQQSNLKLKKKNGILQSAVDRSIYKLN